MKKKLLLFLTCLMTLISTPVYAAYDDTYEWSEDAVLVDNDAKHDNNKITLYYLRSAKSQMTGKFSFDFTYETENLTCRYENWLENATIVESTPEYNLILYRFTVEDGIYTFSTNMPEENFIILTPDFKNPTLGDNSTYKKYPVELSNKSEMSLYAISGTDEFILSQSNNLITFATDRENALNELGRGNANNSTTQTVELPEDIKKQEEEKLEEEQFEETLNNVSELLNKDDNGKITSSNEEKEIVTVEEGTEEPEKENKEESSFDKIYTYAVTILFLIAMVAAGIFKKNK